MADMSIVVPVYNDPDGVQDTLECLTNQTIDDGDYEVIVVDNNSTDNTPEIIKSYPVMYVLEDEIQSSYAARNTGCEHATGDILAFVDADMTVSENWVESVIEEFEATDAEYMGCNVEVTISNGQSNIWARFFRDRGFPIEWYLENHNFAPTCCLVVSRSLYDDLGGFDNRLVSGGDSKFGKRAFAAGYDQHFASEITMYHPARSSLSALISKGSRLGRGVAQKRRLNGNKTVCLRDVLPPHAGRYASRLDGVSMTQFIVYYTLEYIMKLAKAKGIISEIRANSEAQ